MSFPTGWKSLGPRFERVDNLKPSHKYSHQHPYPLIVMNPHHEKLASLEHGDKSSPYIDRLKIKKTLYRQYCNSCPNRKREKKKKRKKRREKTTLYIGQFYAFPIPQPQPSNPTAFSMTKDSKQKCINHSKHLKKKEFISIFNPLRKMKNQIFKPLKKKS